MAVLIGGDWRFVPPVEGLLLFDRGAGRIIVFLSQWHTAPEVAPPTGGAVIDTEARTAITDLIAALRTSGVLGTHTP